jgi:hypothetical protein
MLKYRSNQMIALLWLVTFVTVLVLTVMAGLSR